MSTEHSLRRNGRADPFEMQIGLIGLARELERMQQLTVALQLSVQDLEEQVEELETLDSWLPCVLGFLLAILVIAVVVYAFQPLGVTR